MNKKTSLANCVQTSWIDEQRLVQYILRCQDGEDGGVSDRPGNMADLFHTYFGLCGLLLLGHFEGQSNERFAAFDRIDPTYALPVKVVRRLGLCSQTMAKI